MNAVAEALQQPQGDLLLIRGVEIMDLHAPLTADEVSTGHTMLVLLSMSFNESGSLSFSPIFDARALNLIAADHGRQHRRAAGRRRLHDRTNGRGAR